MGTHTIRAWFNARDVAMVDFAMQQVNIDGRNYTRDMLVCAVLDYAIAQKFELVGDTLYSGSLSQDMGGTGTAAEISARKIRSTQLADINTLRNRRSSAFYVRGAFRTFVKRWALRAYQIEFEWPANFSSIVTEDITVTPMNSSIDMVALVDAVIPLLDYGVDGALVTPDDFVCHPANKTELDAGLNEVNMATPQFYDIMEWSDVTRAAPTSEEIEGTTDVTPKAYRRVSMIRFAGELVAFDTSGARVTSVQNEITQVDTAGITVTGQRTVGRSEHRVRWLVRTAT